MKFNKIVFEDEIIIWGSTVPNVINELLKAESELKAKGHTQIGVNVSSNGRYYEDPEHYIVVNGTHEETDSEFLERIKNEKERILSFIETQYSISIKNLKNIEEKISSIKNNTMTKEEQEKVNKIISRMRTTDINHPSMPYLNSELSKIINRSSNTDDINSLEKEKKSIKKEIRQLQDKYYEYFPDGDFNEEMNKIP